MALSDNRGITVDQLLGFSAADDDIEVAIIRSLGRAIECGDGAGQKWLAPVVRDLANPVEIAQTLGMQVEVGRFNGGGR